MIYRYAVLLRKMDRPAEAGALEAHATTNLTNAGATNPFVAAVQRDLPPSGLQGLRGASQVS